MSIYIEKSEVESYIDEHNIYDLFKCSMCGVSWYEHESSCMRHNKKEYFDRLRAEASKIEKFKPMFNLAKRNGYPDTHLNNNEYSIKDFICEPDEIVP